MRPLIDVTRLAVALFVGVSVGAAFTSSGLRPFDALSSLAPAPVASAPTAAGGSDRATTPRTGERADVAAIKDVIQLANDQQAQAIARNDPTLMRDGATAQHYRELVKTNGDLLSSGVVSIALVKLEWGPIDVSGSTARAVTYETWRSTLRDGSTDQSRDENDHSLVLQDGRWLIDGDDQPGATGAAPGGDPAAPTGIDPAVPPVTTSRNTSSNWSGYAATGGSFTSVTGTWTVPDPKTTTLGAEATWVGIGGMASRDLIQAGTQTSVSGRSVRFEAWIEMLPDVQQTVPLTVGPGDSVTVTITQQQGEDWLISLKDNTTGKAYSTTVQYASSRSSAEWIEEAPSGGRRIIPLDDFGSVSFSAATATENGKTVTIASANARPITLINGARQPLAQPSELGTDGSSFTVTRTAASAGAVPTPPSVPRPHPSRRLIEEIERQEFDLEHVVFDLFDRPTDTGGTTSSRGGFRGCSLTADRQDRTSGVRS